MMTMKRRTIVKLTLILIVSLALLTGCGRSDNHDPITILAAFDDMDTLIDAVHEKYPEINLEPVPYDGKNMTGYMKAQLEAGDMEDIYVTTVYTPGQENLSRKLVDLSSYSFTDEYLGDRLKAVSDEGSIYLLPTYCTCIGITYNKTLLKKHGWKLPSNFKELEELAPKVKEAGCNLAINQIGLPGYGFQYMCNILDTGFLNTIEGRQWQSKFLSGKATVKGTPEMMEAFQLLEKWKNLGMLTYVNSDDSQARKMMAEGNILFMLGSSNTFTEDETTDEFGIMPYLSDDGTQNSLILNVSRYVGLNKKLQAAGNEQKLEDALHVMEVISSVEGMSAASSTFTETSLLPLKDYKIPKDSYYKDVEDEINAGLTAPFIFSGWENAIVPIGNTVISYVKGELRLDDVIQSVDSSRKLLTAEKTGVYTRVTEKLDTDDCARLVGICFAKACGADMALISKSKWYSGSGSKGRNMEGVSGQLFSLPVTEQEIVSVLPTGWHGTVKTVTLTGKRVKELAEEGYDKNGDGKTFPYRLVTPDRMKISDDETYTVVICGVTDKVAKEGNLKDTGIVGLEAAKDYLGKFENISEEDVVWEQDHEK